MDGRFDFKIVYQKLLDVSNSVENESHDILQQLKQIGSIAVGSPQVLVTNIRNVLYVQLLDAFATEPNASFFMQRRGCKPNSTIASCIPLSALPQCEFETSEFVKKISNITGNDPNIMSKDTFETIVSEIILNGVIHFNQCTYGIAGVAVDVFEQTTNNSTITVTPSFDDVLHGIGSKVKHVFSRKEKRGFADLLVYNSINYVLNGNVGNIINIGQLLESSANIYRAFDYYQAFFKNMTAQNLINVFRYVEEISDKNKQIGVRNFALAAIASIAKIEEIQSDLFSTEVWFNLLLDAIRNLWKKKFKNGVVSSAVAIEAKIDDAVAIQNPCVFDFNTIMSKVPTAESFVQYDLTNENHPISQWINGVSALLAEESEKSSSMQTVLDIFTTHIESCSFGGLGLMTEAMNLIANEEKNDEIDSFSTLVRGIARDLRLGSGDLFTFSWIFSLVAKQIPPLERYLNLTTFSLDVVAHVAESLIATNLLEIDSFNATMNRIDRIYWQYFDAVFATIVDPALYKWEGECKWNPNEFLNNIKVAAFDPNDTSTFSMDQFNATKDVFWYAIDKDLNNCTFGLKEYTQNITSLLYLLEDETSKSRRCTNVLDVLYKKECAVSLAEFFLGISLKIRQETSVLFHLNTLAPISENKLPFLFDVAGHLVNFWAFHFSSIDALVHLFSVLELVASESASPDMYELFSKLRLSLKHIVEQNQNHSSNEFFWLALHVVWRVTINEIVVPDINSDAVTNEATLIDKAVPGEDIETDTDIGTTSLTPSLPECMFDSKKLMNQVVKTATGNDSRLSLEDFNTTVNQFLSTIIKETSQCTYGSPRFITKILNILSIEDETSWQAPTFANILRGIAVLSRQERNNIMVYGLQSPIAHISVHILMTGLQRLPIFGPFIFESLRRFNRYFSLNISTDVY